MNEHRVLLFCEGSFVRKTGTMSPREARSYSEGFHEGASEYGSGNVGAYVIPGDEAEMQSWESEKEIQKAMR